VIPHPPHPPQPNLTPYHPTQPHPIPRPTISPHPNPMPPRPRPWQSQALSSQSWSPPSATDGWRSTAPASVPSDATAQPRCLGEAGGHLLLCYSTPRLTGPGSGGGSRGSLSPCAEWCARKTLAWGRETNTTPRSACGPRLPHCANRTAAACWSPSCFKTATAPSRLLPLPTLHIGPILLSLALTFAFGLSLLGPLKLSSA
jgi:hypothetical protein